MFFKRTLTIASKEEIHSVIQFHALSGETLTNLCKKRTSVDGEMSVYGTLVFGWHKRYSDDRESLNGDERLGRPLTKTSLFAVNQARLMLEQDRGKIVSCKPHSYKLHRHFH